MNLGLRPARTTLTMLGTVLGVGSFVVVLGLTSTGAGQIDSAFSMQTATQVVLSDAGGDLSGEGTTDNLPEDAETRVERLNGVEAAGVTWPVGGGATVVSTSLRPDAHSAQIAVAAASPGYLRAAEFSMEAGSGINGFQRTHALPIAVVGTAVADQLGIGPLTATTPALFIDGQAFTVIGIVRAAARDPLAASTVYIPDTTARALFGAPLTYATASMLIRTRIGAADLVAAQVAVALRPDAPELIAVVAPPQPTALRGAVFDSLSGLFLILAAVTLLIGAVSIANTTLVSVMERTAEIGLRRALGARPRHIAAQFLAESAMIGTVGGVVGTALAIAAVLAVALARQWTAVLDPVATFAAPLAGTLAGIAAGVYPALLASRIEPLDALRR